MANPEDEDLERPGKLDPRFQDAPVDPEWEPSGRSRAPEASGRRPTAPSTPTEPSSPPSEDDTRPEGYEPPLAWEVSPTLLRLPPNRRPAIGPPGQGVACATCPVSIWFVAPSMVRCHCPPLMVVTWETGQPMEISLCDARERAIELALQQQHQGLAEGS